MMVESSLLSSLRDTVTCETGLKYPSVIGRGPQPATKHKTEFNHTSHVTPVIEMIRPVIIKVYCSSVI